MCLTCSSGECVCNLLHPSSTQSKLVIPLWLRDSKELLPNVKKILKNVIGRSKAVTHYGTWAACHQVPPHAPPLFL